MMALWRWLTGRQLVDLGSCEDWSEHRAKRQARVTAQYLGLPLTDAREIYQPEKAKPDHRAFWAAQDKQASKPPGRVIPMRRKA